MSEKALELINQGIFEIEGASNYFFEFKRKYPTYDDIKKEYIETTNLKKQLKDLVV